MSLLSSAEYKAKAENHTQWLCWIFGLTTILMAIAALEFPSPWRIAWLGLSAIVPMYVYAFTGHPEELRVLRELAKDQGASDRAVAAQRLKEVEVEFHGWRTALRMAILWIALVLYIAVCFSFTSPFCHILWFAR